jgi:hypothetical protein
MRDAAQVEVLVRDLLDVATDRNAHIYCGSCPDQVEGPGVRDPYCPACQVLLRADAMLERTAS